MCENAVAQLVEVPEVGEDGFIRSIVDDLSPESPQICRVVSLDDCITMDGVHARPPVPMQLAGPVTPPAMAEVSANRLDETPEDITLSFTMPGDDGFDGRATRITIESGAWPFALRTAKSPC